ncbi:MAG: ABC transporter substrate-binding protein [Parasporobacterium sp.]|nr:ABC transporter substrate-binding protein [Parasporobacterium sp.]
MKKTRIFAIVMAMAMLMSCLFAGSAFAADALKIGATGPLTGDASSYGISVNQGANLAVEEINAAGGVNGYELEFNMIDDKAAAADATTGFGQLMDWGMQASLGSVTSGSCEAFGQQAAQYHVFFLTPSASAASVIATGDTAFRVCFGDPDQGTLAAQELTSRFEKIGCIYDTSDTYSAGIYAAFDEEMKNLGVEYQTFTFDQDNKKSFSAQVEALKDCQVIFCPFYYTEASLVAKECSSSGHGDILLFGCDGFDGLAPLLDDTVTNPIEYITPFDVESTDEKTAAFVANYTEKYGAAPDQFAADGYDCIYTIAALLEAAGVEDTSIDFASLADILVAQITADDFSYDGVTGTMTWDASGASTKIPVIVILN